MHTCMSAHTCAQVGHGGNGCLESPVGSTQPRDRWPQEGDKCLSILENEQALTSQGAAQVGGKT